MKATKKFLSVLLSVVMVFTVFNVAFVSLAPEVYAAPSGTDYAELANAIRTLRARDPNAKLSVSGTNATYSDSVGDMIPVAEKYYEIFKGLVPTGTINQNTTTNRTATMINDTIKTQIQGHFSVEELTSWSAIEALLNSMIANQTNINSGTQNTSAQTAPNITVKITNTKGMLDYDNVDELPATIVGSYTYEYPHSSPSYSSGSGCNAKTYYYVKIGTVSRKTGDTIDTTPVKALNTKIAAYAGYYSCTFAELVAMDADTLTAVKNDLGGAYNAVASDVYAHFFSAYDTATLLDDIGAAIAIQTYIGIAQALQATTTVDISDYTFDELSDFYFEMVGKLESYNGAPAATRSFLEEQGYVVMADVDAKFTEVENAYEIAYLRDTVKPRLEADLETYATYTDEWTVATDGVEGILAAAETEIEYIKGEITSKKSWNVEAVFGEGYDINEVFAPVTDNFAHIRAVNGYNLTFKQYQDVYNAAFAPLTLNETDAQLLNILRQRDGWYTQLQAFAAELAEYDADVAALILTDAEAAMEAKIDQTYAALNAILETQVADAWAIYQTQSDEQGLLITEVNLSTYNTLMTSVGRINADAYDFLDGTVHFDLSDDTVEKYEALQSIVIALRNWDPSQHLSAYKYNAETLDPIVRYVDEVNEDARDRDYVVTDEYLQDLIDQLSALLNDGGLEDLGLELDLSTTLDGIWEKMYTDAFVNTLMGALYPMLSELVRDKLNDLVGDYLSYFGDLDDAFEKLNIGLAPKKVGTHVDSARYPVIAAALKNVSGGFMDGSGEGDNCWTSTDARNKIWRVVVDDDGNQVLDDDGNPTYELIFDWGIDAAEGMEAKKEAFLNAVDSALKGVQPLFMALLCNKAVPTTQVVSALFGLATVSLGMKANDGYNNTLIPIFEAMGVHADALYNARNYSNVRDIFEYGLISPLTDLFGQIKADPLNKILEILPTLAFAIQNNLVMELFHNLKVDLDVQGGGCAASIINNQLPSEGVSIDLGNELNFADLLGIETFYEDILSIDGVLGIVLSLLAGDEEEAEEPAEGEEPAEPAPELRLPHMDGAKLAMLGTDVVWADSFRSKSQITYEGRVNIHANIVANKPQVMQFLLEYILEALQDDEFIPAILYMVNKDKPEEEQTELPEMVNTILARVRASGTDALAAVFELMHPVYRYTAPPGITWITEGNITEPDYVEFWTGDNAELTQTDWVREDALFVMEHLEEVLNYIVKLLGDKVGNAQTLGEAVAYFAGSLFTAETANSIKEALGGLLSGLELPEAIAEMDLFGQIGIDPAAWDNMADFSFNDGDVAAFKAALIQVLDPLAPLLQFLLAERDVELTLLDSLTVSAVGYDGYSYGIVPLLEALRCTGVKTTEEFIADRDNIVANIVNPLFTAVDALIADPLGFIGEIIPSVIYFDMVDALAVVFDHVFFAVDVLTETIRPIYEIDLRELLADQLSFDLDALASNPLQFVMTKVSELVAEKAGLALTIDYTEETVRGKLHFTTPEEFTSKNGDPAYTIHLSDNGKAELLVRLLDYVMAQLTVGENADKLTELVTNLIDSDGASEVVDTILNNFVNNYPDSVVALVKLLFPERQTVEPVKIEWITDNIGATEYAAYWTAEDEPYWATDAAAVPVYEWTKDEAAFVDSHIEEVLGSLVKLLGDKVGGAEDLGGAVAYLLGSLFTAETANKLVGALKGLVDGFGLPEAVLGIFEAFGLNISAWNEMEFDFEDGDKTAFKNALITILNPLAPVLRFLLIGGGSGDLSGDVLDAIPVTLMGYDGYSYGLVPLLEALGCTGIKTTEAFASDADNVVANIVNPLFTLVDQLVADPLAVIKRIVPALIYFDKVNGIQVAIQNLLLSVNVVLDTARPLYDLDLAALLADKVGIDLTSYDVSVLQFLLDKVPDLLGDTLGDLSLNLFSVDDITGHVHFTDPAAFDSANGDDGYTNTLTDDGVLELLIFVLDYAVNDVVFEENNEAVIRGMINDGMGEGATDGIVGEILNNFKTNYHDSLLSVFYLMYPERVEMTAPKIEWITEGNIGADFYDNYWTEVAASGNQTLWTEEKAVYMAEHLGDFLNDIAVIFGEQLGGAESLEDAVDYLLGNLYTADTANQLAGAIKNLVSGFGLPDAVLDIIKDFNVDLHAWDEMSFSFEDGNKAAFKAAVIQILQPLAPVLRFILIEGGDLEGDVLDAVPVKLLGYDGYSYGLVPLLEALGCKNIKTTEAFKADKANVVRNIVDPVFSLLDTIQANPLKFIEDVIPGLIYFDKVGGVQVAIENLLFSVNRVLDIVRPLYDVDIYELVNEKAGIDLHFAEEDPVDFLLVKIGDMIEENTDITLEVDFTVDSLSSKLHFTDPIKYTSANGDDRYTIRLTTEGKADLVTQVLDFGIEQIVFADNVANLKVLLSDLISDQNILVLVTSLLDNLRMLDEDVQDFHKINDVALATVFWIFFGADSVTDADADFFHRFNKDEDSCIDFLLMALDSSVPYMERFGFIAEEIISVEYPALMQALENARSLKDKHPFDYTPEEVHYVSGILARIISFILHLIAYLKVTRGN